MPPPVPARFLVRVAHPCLHVAEMPQTGKSGSLLDLPESARLEHYPALDGAPSFADVRVAWNATGLGVQVTVADKEAEPEGDADKPRSSDGVTIWIDTRDSRTSHRASRYCHQFQLLPSGGGPDKDEPAVLQSKINRALQDAPLFAAGSVPFRCVRERGGYRVETFLPAAVLTGFDPEQFPRLGIYYHVRDGELGDQYLGVNADFPISDDPSLWEVLELIPGERGA